MTPNEKRKKLAELIELYIFCGYDIASLMGRELGYFNFDFVEETILRLKEEKEQQG